MNKTFSVQRFTLLVQKHWSENKKRYALSVLAYMGLLVMWFGYIIFTDPQDPMADGLQQVTYLFPLLVTGAIYSSQYFSALGTGPRAIAFLMVPASHVEKLLCALFYSVVVFFIVYTLSFYIVDALVIAIANRTHDSYTAAAGGASPQKAMIANLLAPVDPRGPRLNLSYFLLFLSVQAAYLLGSVYFARYSLIKTAISSFVVLMIFFGMIYVFTDTVMPGGSYFSLTSFRFWDAAGKPVIVQTPRWMGVVVQYVATYALPPLLWAATYYRMKEKQA